MSSVIGRPEFAALGDVLVGLAVNPNFCGFYAREFHNQPFHQSGSPGKALQACHRLKKHFDRMILHRCFDSSPIFVELFLIDGFSSREDIMLT